MRLSALAVLLVAGGCFAQAETEAPKVYNSPDGTYVVEYPASWNHYPEATSLYILSFPLPRISREILLPRNGAMITFAKTQPQTRSLEEWIGKDVARRGIDGKLEFRLDLEYQRFAVAVTETVSHSTRGQYTFEEVDWYFALSGRLFDAVLLYHKGDPHRMEYRQVLTKVATSIRVPPMPAGR
jgi:hypothetical protein